MGVSIAYFPELSLILSILKMKIVQPLLPPCHMGMQTSNNTSVSLFPRFALSSPFASPASSEVGGQSVQVGGNPFMSIGFLSFDGRERESSFVKDDVAAYFSADAIEARELMINRSNIVPNPNILLNANPYGMRVSMSSLMMLPCQPSFLQESRALNQNTHIGSPQRHGGAGTIEFGIIWAQHCRDEASFQRKDCTPLRRQLATVASLPGKHHFHFRTRYSILLLPMLG